MKSPKLLAIAIAIKSIFFSSMLFAEETQSLPTIEVTATAEENAYHKSESNSSTGLNLTKKQTPQSTSTVTQKLIADKKLSTISDALNATTGVNVLKTDSSRNSISSRGYAVDRFLVDGMDYNFTGGWNSGEDKTSLDTLERVEVVRGSTGLMSGIGNASAGVNLIRKHATKNEPSGEVAVSLDNFMHYKTMIDYGQALNKNETVRGRIVASYDDGDTFINREQKGKTLVYGALDIDVSPNTLLQATAKYEDNKQHGVMWGGLPSVYNNGSLTNWSVDANIAPDWAKWDSTIQDYSLSVEHKFNERWNAKIASNYLRSKADLALVFAGLQPALDGTLNTTLYPNKYDVETTQSNIQAKVNGGFDLLGRTHQLAFGVDQTQYDYDVTASSTAPYTVGNMSELLSGNVANLQITGSPKPNGAFQSTKKTAFISGQFSLAKPLSLVLGTRMVDYENRSKRNIGTQWESSSTQNIDKKWTSYAGLTYEINPNFSVYTSYTDIFQPQTNAPRTETGAYLDKPITGTSYEIGLKASNNNDTLHGQINLFQSKRQNVTEATGANVANATPPEQAYRYVDGEEKRTGVEVELSGQITPRFNALAGYSWVKSEDAKGKRTNTSTPRHTIKAFGTYDVLDNLTLGLGANYMSTYYSNAVLSQKPVTLVNAMARYKVNPQTSLQLNVDNLTDKKYVQAFGWSQIGYGEPRKATLSLTYKF